MQIKAFFVFGVILLQMKLILSEIKIIVSRLVRVYCTNYMYTVTSVNKYTSCVNCLAFYLSQFAAFFIINSAKRRRKL